MARQFTAASSQYLSQGSAVVDLTGAFSFAAWCNAPTLPSGGATIMSIGTTSSTDYVRLLLFGTGDASPSVLNALSTDGTNTNTAVGTTALTAGEWTHAGASYNTVGTPRVYYNGAMEHEHIFQTVDPSGQNATVIGRTERPSPGLYWDGYIAEVGIWNVQITTADYLILAAGYSPLLVKPNNLVAYWPLIGRMSPEIDLVGGFDLTLTAGPGTAPHPPKISYPVPDLSYISAQGETKGVEEIHRFRFNDVDPVATFRTFIRSSSDWASAHTPTRAYEVSIANTGGYTINRIESGSRTLIGSGPWVSDTLWWWIKFQAVGTRIRFKMWRDGQGEPVAWMNDIDDSLDGFTIAGRMQLALRTGA